MYNIKSFIPPSNNNNKGRILWIDWLKIIGMLLIVWGHFFPQKLSPFLYSFSVPVFFFISGYLSANKKRTLKNEFKHTTKTLCIPMCSMLFINWAINYRKMLFSDPIEETIIEPFLKTAVGYHTPLLHTLWFVYDLIIIRLIISIIKDKYYNYLLFLSFGIMFIINNIDYPPVSFINIWGGLFYYIIGIIIGQNQIIKLLKEKVSNLNKVSIICVIISLLIFQVFFSEINGRNYLYNASYGKYLLLSVILSFTGIILLIIISSFMKNINPSWLNYINTGAIIILGLHYRVITYITSILHINNNDIISFILSIIILLSFIPLIILAKKYFPWILGR